LAELIRESGERKETMENPDLKRLRNEHFWVSSGPFFESALFMVPTSSGCPATTLLQCELYNTEGECFNTLEIEQATNQTGLLELAQLMEACTVESGMRHAQLKVRHSGDLTMLHRIHCRQRACFLSSEIFADRGEPFAIPVELEQGRSHIFAVINPEQNAVTVRMKLLAGKRKPEHTVVIPPNGTRIIGVESIFREFQPGEGKSLQAYLRVSAANDQRLFLQLLEGSERSGEFSLLGGLS